MVNFQGIQWFGVLLCYLHNTIDGNDLSDLTAEELNNFIG